MVRDKRSAQDSVGLAPRCPRRPMTISRPTVAEPASTIRCSPLGVHDRLCALLCPVGIQPIRRARSLARRRGSKLRNRGAAWPVARLQPLGSSRRACPAIPFQSVVHPTRPFLAPLQPSLARHPPQTQLLPSAAGARHAQIALVSAPVLRSARFPPRAACRASSVVLRRPRPECSSFAMAPVLALMWIVAFFARRSVQQQDQLQDFCRRFGHQTAVIDNR
jgi:hypothetical protein